MYRQKISTHLWFDKEAVEAANFYTSHFKNSEILSTVKLENTPSGEVDMVTIKLSGQELTMISAGPLFKINPAISFLVAVETKEEVDRLWKELIDDGMVMMELGEYPFSDWYGWVQDKYGVSWQIMYRSGQKITQTITPTLMFVGEVCGRAKEAMNYYISIFPNSNTGETMLYDKNEEPDVEGTIKHAEFTLSGVQMAIMDSAMDHKFGFNEAVSFIIHCEDQTEIDYFTEKLSFVPESEQCGWVKDKFGVSWQIVPNSMEEMMQSKDKNKVAKVTEAFLKMKKFDLKELNKVFDES